MSMPRAAVSFLTSCSDSSKGWRGQRPTLNLRPEARAKGYGSMSRLACAACGAEDQIATAALVLARAGVTAADTSRATTPCPQLGPACEKGIGRQSVAWSPYRLCAQHNARSVDHE